MTTPRVTVPVKPTEAMIEAAEKAADDKPTNGWGNLVDLTPAETWAAMLSAAPAPEGGAGDVPEDDELPGDFLARVGMDGALWADGFRKMALKLGYSDMDEGWLIGWFCNAVMAGYDHAQRRFDPALATREEAPAEAGEPKYFAAFMAEDGALRAQPPAREDAQPVAWACLTCNSPRAVDPCPKCGTALTEPAKGWAWPRTPDVARIRALAREVGYAIGVHGTMERDLDLIAAPWVAEAVTPLELAQHIASALGGNVLAYKVQDKPCGRWSCNIDANGWFKLIDLSVMPPITHPAPDALREAGEALEPFNRAYQAYLAAYANFMPSGATEAEKRFAEGERKDIAEEAAFEVLSKITLEQLCAVNEALAALQAEQGAK